MGIKVRAIGEERGSLGKRFFASTRVTFSIVTTICTTAIGLWFLGVVGLEARVAHTIGDFIRLVSASA